MPKIKVIRGVNDLNTTHPHLAREADGWDPKEFFAGSHKKMNWKCKKGHKWLVAIEYRTRDGTNCPVCAGKAVHRGDNDLRTLFPLIAAEADGWDPSSFTASSGKRMSWKCPKGHKYVAAIYSRTGKGKSGCPYCSNRRVSRGENDLASTHPDIAKEASGWDPRTVSAGAGVKKKWKCPKGHKYVAAIYSRTGKGKSGCPVCANITVKAGINDLATTHPELIREVDGWDPSKFVSGSSQKMNWLCLSGHRYKSPINARALRNTGCPICKNKVLLQGFNDLQSKYPLLGKEANGWDPRGVLAGTHKKLEWRCAKKHCWKAQVASRVQGRGCPICSNQITQSGVNDLATTHPEIASEAYGWDPRLINAGSHKKMNWQCSIGHIWEASVFTRMRGKGEGCPICSNHRLLVGFNDLATTHPFLIPEVYKWDPTKVTAGSGVKKKWKCSEGHIWETVIGHRTGSKKTGCPSCAKYGFKPDEEAFLYLLEQKDWEMLQIGITNDLENRLNKHKGQGWEVVELRGPMDGHLTQQWETAILRMLKAKGADLSNSKIAGKFDGYSEAWSKSTFPVKSIKELMRLTEEYEEKK